MEALEGGEDDSATRLRVVWGEGLGEAGEALGTVFDRTVLLVVRGFLPTERAEGTEDNVALRVGSRKVAKGVIDPCTERRRRDASDDRAVPWAVAERVERLFKLRICIKGGSAR